MTYRSSSFLLGALICLTPIPAIAGDQIGEIPPPSRYELPEDRCPELKEAADASFNVEYISELSKIQTDCTTSVRHLRSRSMSLTLIEYLYSFQETDGVMSQQQFNYIVRDSDRHVLWKYRAGEYPISSLSGAKTRSIGSRDLLELQLFTGGTAGYWEEYLSISREGLQRVTESFLKSSEALIPPGYERRRVRISFPDLHATMFLATKKDPNCCPSGRLDSQLILKDNDLALVEGHFYRVNVQE